MSEPGPHEDQYAATLELLSSLITQDHRGAGQWETVHEYMGSWVQVTDCTTREAQVANTAKLQQEAEVLCCRDWDSRSLFRS